MLLPHEPLPWGTLLVNTVGAFVIGVLNGGLQRSWPKWLQQGATTGFLGGFTTYSALALWLTHDDLDHWSLIIGVAAAVIGIAAAFVGLLLGERWGGVATDGSGNGSTPGGSTEADDGWLPQTRDDSDADPDVTADEEPGQDESIGGPSVSARRRVILAPGKLFAAVRQRRSVAADAAPRVAPGQAPDEADVLEHVEASLADAPARKRKLLVLRRRRRPEQADGGADA